MKHIYGSGDPKGERHYVILRHHDGEPAGTFNLHHGREIESLTERIGKMAVEILGKNPPDLTLNVSTLEFIES